MERILFDTLEVMQVKLTSFIFSGLTGFFEMKLISETGPSGAFWYSGFIAISLGDFSILKMDTGA